MKITYRIHAIQRMFQRSVSTENIRMVLQTGNTIEAYPDDSPYPSRLILGWIENRPLHIVVAENRNENEVIVITVYEPDPHRWEDDYKRRKL